MATVNVTVRIDKELKREAEELFDDLGLTMSSAITVFIKQAVRQQKIPFELSRNIPNRETLEALEEARRIASGELEVKSYTDAKEMFNDILNEVEDD
jgi:DNA-damage-inducible protein J